MLVAEAELGEVNPKLKVTRSFADDVSKFEPEIVTEVPATPIVGVKPVIVGNPVALETVKGLTDVAVPAVVVMLIVPVVAPLGTVAVSWVAVAEVTVAEVPLKFTVFPLGVVLKAVPLIATEAPTGPFCGVNPLMES